MKELQLVDPDERKLEIESTMKWVVGLWITHPGSMDKLWKSLKAFPQLTHTPQNR